MATSRSEQRNGRRLAGLTVALALASLTSVAQARAGDAVGAGGAGDGDADDVPRTIELAELPPDPAPPAGPPTAVIDELAEAAVGDGDLDPTDLRGGAAVAALEAADVLDEVADDLGVAEDELVEELLEDSTMFVGATGDVGYVERLPAPDDDDHDHGDHDHDHHDQDDHDDEGAGRLGVDHFRVDQLTGDVSLDGDGDEPALLTGTAVGDLHSYEGSPATLYLDFTGHTTTSAAWAGLGFPVPFVSAPFSRDDDPDEFTMAEQQEIFEIWLQVAEDYAPFGVDVTTDPTVAIDQRVVVSPTNLFEGLVAGWEGILGVAVVGSFGASSEIPAFVFTGEGAGHLPTTWIAEAISHESGHTFGLRHDGRRVGASTEEYYAGHDAWAPIMGLAIQRDVSQWSRGDYRCANRTEDDLATIAGLAGYRADDWPGGPDPAISGTGSVTGILGAGNDVDPIRVSTSGGPTTVTVTPLGPSPNLHPEVTVRSNSGAVLGVAVPATPAGPSTVSLPNVAAGSFVVEVRPSSWYGPIAGFGTYGSMGAYEVDVTAGYTPPTLGVTAPAESIAAAVGLDRAPIC